GTQVFPHRKTFTVDGIQEIHVLLAGGNDSLTMYNTSIPVTLTIDMGAGKDTLRMTNVHTLGAKSTHSLDGAPISISLGDGNDLAVLKKVTAAADLSIEAGMGQDKVKLRQVTVGSVGSGNALTVEMGAGNRDVLKVKSSAADDASFNDTLGTKGTLLRLD